MISEGKRIQVYSLGYRADIEGLRALAVILVVLAHSQVPGLSGGFIGVDIFFVISGYLITGLLVKEATQSGKIGFSSFYARRLKRLAPALYTMLLVCTAITYLLISPLDQTRHLNAAGNAAMWLSNFHFALQDIDYFSPGENENLFLHTWSLSVEEQFYLVWPGLVFLLWVSTKRLNAKQHIRVLFSGMLAVCALSFVACWYWTNENPSLAYFLPFSRAWQFAVGSIAVLASFSGRSGLGSIAVTKTVNPPIVNNLVAFTGLMLIACAVVFYTAETPYPGSWSVLPTIGTVLLLIAGSSSNVLSNFLSAKHWTFIGQLSYGWYLWHWPFLIFAKVIDPHFSPESRIIAVFSSFLAAWVSNIWIETPIRRSTYLSSRPKVVLLLSLTSMAAAVITPLLIAQNNFDQILTSDRMEKLYLARSDMPQIYYDGCDEWVDSAEIKRCDYGEIDPENEAFLIGDSVAGQWFSGFKGIADKPGWRLRVFTKSACPMIDEPFFYQTIGMRYQVCEIWRDRVVNEILDSRPDLVIMGSSSSYPFSNEKWLLGTRKFLDKFAGQVKEVVILRPTPVLKMDVTSCAANKIWQESTLPFQLPSRCIEYNADATAERIAKVLNEIALDYQNVRIVNLNDLVCPDYMCPGMIGDMVVFRDRSHLSDTFVVSIAKDIYKLIGLE